MTNTELLGKIIQKSGLKKEYLAKQIGVSRGTFRALITNKKEFKTSQVETLCKILDIKDDASIKAIFFASFGA